MRRHTHLVYISCTVMVLSIKFDAVAGSSGDHPSLGFPNHTCVFRIVENRWIISVSFSSPFPLPSLGPITAFCVRLYAVEHGGQREANFFTNSGSERIAAYLDRAITAHGRDRAGTGNAEGGHQPVMRAFAGTHQGALYCRRRLSVLLLLSFRHVSCSLVRLPSPLSPLVFLSASA